jgi:peptidoglycan/LPS O-acetylase OafA/YrhL
MRTQNNFDFLRITAASLVLISHQFVLLGRPEPAIGNFHSIGGLGVLIFFSISGYLVAQSWERDPAPGRFLARRVLRIWPGLICVTALAALVLGPIVSTQAPQQYFTDPLVRRFFATLYMSMQNRLPGVFDSYPAIANVNNYVNGSLWTLPAEVRWYMGLMVLGMAGLLNRRWPLLAITAGLAVVVFGVLDVQHSGTRTWSFEFGAFFLYGSCLHFHHDAIRRHGKAVLWTLALTSAALLAIGHGYAALLVVLPPAVIAIGTASTPIIRRFGRFGDVSYGLYIYAFPVQQTFILLFGRQWSLPTLLFASAACTLVVAWLSWHFVERPALGLKRWVDAPRAQGRAADTASLTAR